MKILDQNLKKLIKAGVYNKEDEHDACGVGFVASIDGKPRREVVENGIEALKAVWHRGAVDKDGKTGDGAGIHLELSKDFFEEQIKITGHHTHKNDQLCVGMIFLPRNDYGAQEACRTIVEHEILSNNFYIFGWRQVPVKAKVLGIKANDTRPEIEQILFSPIEKTGSEELEKNIYIIRKKIEKKIAQSQLKDFYISSISSRSIIYKGMFLAEHLSDFYPDLLDKRFISRFSIFHQRYSTNTFPSWELAQPFRILAHNGEINTLKGNINWMKTHEQGLESNLYPNIEDLKPILKSGSSDTACLDAIFELLTRSGRLLPLVKMMLMPEAWSKRSKIIPKAYRDMYNYLNSVIEPWDGPAAIAATDGNWILAATDRNGLRPLRYTITKDKILFAGSETGMVPVKEENIIYRGRVGPGQMIAVNLDEGVYYNDKKIKDYLSRNPIYKKFTQNQVEISKKFNNLEEFNSFEGDKLRQKQYAAGISIEDLEMILHPMVEDQKEAVGSVSYTHLTLPTKRIV